MVPDTPGKEVTVHHQILLTVVLVHHSPALDLHPDQEQDLHLVQELDLHLDQELDLHLHLALDQHLVQELDHLLDKAQHPEKVFQHQALEAHHHHQAAAVNYLDLI